MLHNFVISLRTFLVAAVISLLTVACGSNNSSTPPGTTPPDNNNSGMNGTDDNSDNSPDTDDSDNGGDSTDGDNPDSQDGNDGDSSTGDMGGDGGDGDSSGDDDPGDGSNDNGDGGSDPGEPDDGDDNTGDGGDQTGLHRYSMANQCWAFQSVESGQFVALANDTLSVTAANLDEAEPIYMKPTALGSYLLLDSQGMVLQLDEDGVSRVSRLDANPSTDFVVLAQGDTTEYPATPQYHTEPTLEQVQLWTNFVDPLVTAEQFTFATVADGQVLSAGDGGALESSESREVATSSFTMVPHQGCMTYPEASSDFTGTPFAGTQPDGSVIGHADVHIHISATEFLGDAQWGRPFHPYGIEHALGNCSVDHGQFGEQDFLGAAYGGDLDGHATDGWPTFTDWPSRGSLTHDALYWKWLERAWAGGLRVIVNDLVDNQTLCEIERNVTNDPSYDCDPMNNAGRQAGTMYQMENYIDAQYGGPGKGFFQLVHSADEARSVIEDGKAAVILGIEISNLFNCQLTYNPLRQQPPHQEDGTSIGENRYGCTAEEGQPNSVLTQMQRVWDWGVRQIISIHEFDNAFGGNGIFDMGILNLGNRENSGGIPGQQIQLLSSAFLNQDPNAAAELAAAIPQTETPTGEFWNTYDCPIEGETENFSGYLWSSRGGAEAVTSPLMLSCPPLLSGNGGGAAYCYPAGVGQCNARWMTPIGLYTYSKFMEFGFIFDFDHMEMGMKTQALELAEAQTITYPLVSTHGTFGGTTVDQAERVLAGGGFLYPSNGSSRGFRNDLAETLGIHSAALDGDVVDGAEYFGFGYGTDTNGLSTQSGPRGSNIEQPLTYPFTFYSGGKWDELGIFNENAAVVFEQPSSRDENGNVARTWHQDMDGTAHGGMVTDWLQEVALEGTAEDLQHVFNSAERFLRTWKQTEQSSAEIRANGLKMPVDDILRPAPPEGLPPR